MTRPRTSISSSGLRHRALLGHGVAECARGLRLRLWRAPVPGLGAGPRFLPLRPGKFLVEFDCGARGYNPFKVYVLYDETKSPVTAKLLRFPYYPFGSLSDPDHAPPLTWKTEFISRGELIVFAKFRGLGDAASSPVTSFPERSRFCANFASRRRAMIAGPMRFSLMTRQTPRDGEG
jgi:hypothetical protein